MKFLLKRRSQRDDKKKSLTVNLRSLKLSNLGRSSSSGCLNDTVFDDPADRSSNSDVPSCLLKRSETFSDGVAQRNSAPRKTADLFSTSDTQESHSPQNSSIHKISSLDTRVQSQTSSSVFEAPANNESLNNDNSPPKQVTSNNSSSPDLKLSHFPFSSDSLNSHPLSSPRRVSWVDMNPTSLIKDNPDVSIASTYTLELGDKDVDDILLDKVNLCCTVYDFQDENENLEAKREKEHTLLELIGYINNLDEPMSQHMVEALLHMVSANIFRARSPPTETFVYITNLVDADEEEPKWEPSWRHLELVYVLFLRFIVSSSVEAKVLKQYVDEKFVLKLLGLFSCEDPRERDYLKTVLHRIYGKIMALRMFIRKSIHHRFIFFLEQGEIHRGIAELLEILASIINGFIRPLKEEHKMFLKKSLLPLHKSRSLGSFHQQLTYCMVQYLEKDESLVVDIIQDLIRYWPMTNTSKEVLLLSEIEEILEYAQLVDFEEIMVPLFRQLVMCIESLHFQVAERVLFMWNNECVLKLINVHRQTLFPIVIPALYRNSKTHWNSTVHGLTFNVMKILEGIDRELFNECTLASSKQKELLEKKEQYRCRMWKELKHKYADRLQREGQLSSCYTC